MNYKVELNRQKRFNWLIVYDDIKLNIILVDS